MTKRTLTPARDPLSDDDLWHLDADQFLKLKLTEEEKRRLREINERKELERKDRAIRIKIEQEPILAELRGIGMILTELGDLIRVSIPCPKAIPILLKHLRFPYSDSIRETLARILAVPEKQVQEAWAVLVAEYRRAPTGKGIRTIGDSRQYDLGAKDGLACALAAAVTDETLPELIELTKDRSHGQSRLLLLLALKKHRRTNQKAADAIAALRDDPLFEREISSWDM